MSDPVLSRDTLLSARQDLLASALSEEELVMMDMDEGTYYGVSHVAKLIWEQLGESHTVGTLVDLVQKEFTEDPATIEQDVTEFLQELVSTGLVKIVTGPAANT